LPTRVLALSAYADERYVRGMIEAQTVGYLLKDEAPSVIVAAVRAAAQGEGWFSAQVAAQIASWARGEEMRLHGLNEVMSSYNDLLILCSITRLMLNRLKPFTSS